ncbi:MAG TPA: hemolysin family protein [Candidatus Anoxymicrobiaceae bacterium]
MTANVFGFLALVALIALAAYFAACETALMRVSRIRVRYLVEKRVKKADKLEKLIEKPDFFYPTVLLLGLAVQLTAASLATWLTIRITHNSGLGVAIGTIIITALMFIFGELVPKAAASHNSEGIALRVTRPVTLLSRIFSPLTWLLEWIARGLLMFIGHKIDLNEGIITEEGEIKALVSAAEEQDVIEEEEKEMIHSVFEFSDTLVREVMVPRPDMVALRSETSMQDALITVMEYGYSRIPVYMGELDNIVGVLYAKDLMAHLQEGKLDHPISEILRKAIIIPETQVLSELLKDLKKRKVHMSIVVDEYGTVVGLVTIEDLLEEIVGEIFDEYDREVSLVEKIDERHYRVDARMNLEDLSEILQVDIPGASDVDSVGGLVLKVLGHLPATGEKFDYNGISIRVEKLRSNRITKVILQLLESKTAQDGE